ncbi:MAG TPA: oxidoreductase, partial [Alcanivorax sp.]|nr:oxidoreductase [Alcanivorax sp.]
MGKMILDGEIVDNGWQRFEPGQLEEDGQSLPENQPVIVPLAYWQAHRDTLLEREAPVGVCL